MFGNIQTCIVDSTAILNEPVILIKLNGDKQINSSCNIEEAVTFNDVEWWPSWIHFDFKTCYFFYVCNPKPIEGKGSYSYDDGEGSLRYDHKNKILSLLIPEFNWQKSYSLNYDAQSQIVQLKEIVNEKLIKVKNHKKRDTTRILNRSQ